MLSLKYLKHKTKANRLPDMVKRLAFAICSYMKYLEGIPMAVTQVCKQDNKKQSKRFIDFLH